ncbi:MAG: hypothetical protein K2K97_09535, partial [Muribaculaceae bacterium]|nr:hypothetical protein [Muribaculaceae bacterium]
MGQISEKSYKGPDGSLYKVEPDGSITKIGGGIKPPEPYEPKSSKKSSLSKWIISLSLFIIIGLIGYYLFTGFANKSAEFDRSEVIDFVTGYYHSIINDEDPLLFYEDDEITYFDLVRVNKEAVRKRMAKADRNVEFEFDWPTLKVINLPSDDIMAIYSFDYY